MRVAYSSRARTDLEEIGDYIALDSPQAAENVIEALRERCDDLGSMPTKFPVAFRRRGRELRRRPYGSYLIFYAVGEQRVEIVSIIHASRDVEKVLFSN